MSFSTHAADVLPKEQQLHAAFLKNKDAGTIAQTSIDVFDNTCGNTSDRQTRLYLDSDLHATLVVLHSLLPKVAFESLHYTSLQSANCHDYDSALNYINATLGIK